MITLERTPCFGSCPDYAVTLHGDGSVHYEGRGFVKITGMQEKTISRDAVIGLLREFYRIDFFSLKDVYRDVRHVEVGADGTVTEGRMMVTDLPTTYITIRIGSYLKRIEDYFGAPQELVDLAKQIDTVTGTAEWVGSH
jgi:hypothetical protein